MCHVFHKFLLFQITILIWACYIIMHAVHAKHNELVLHDHMLGEDGALDVLAAEHTVISCELKWLYDGLGLVLDQDVGGDVLVLPAEEVHRGVGIAVDCQ